MDLSLSLNSCLHSIYICKAEIDRGVLFGNLGLFVPVTQPANCGIYFAFPKVCRNVIQPISPEILCNSLITLHTHTPCHISLAVQQILVIKKTVA